MDELTASLKMLPLPMEGYAFQLLGDNSRVRACDVKIIIKKNS